MLPRISTAIFGLLGIERPREAPAWPAVVLIGAVAAYLLWCCFGPL
jgi:hypothetical protein